MIFSNLVMNNVTGPISISAGPRGRGRRPPGMVGGGTNAVAGASAVSSMDTNAVSNARTNMPGGFSTPLTPEELAQPPGIVRNISFSNIRATVVKPFQLPDCDFTSNYNPGEVFSCIGLNAVGAGFLENISFNDVHVIFPGGGTAEQAAVRDVPKVIGEYYAAGVFPAYALYARNVRGLTLNNVRFELAASDFAARRGVRPRERRGGERPERAGRQGRRIGLAFHGFAGCFVECDTSAHACRQFFCKWKARTMETSLWTAAICPRRTNRWRFRTARKQKPSSSVPDTCHSATGFNSSERNRINSPPAPARRPKLGDDGNRMKADGNSFPGFSLGWTIGGSARVSRAGSGVAPEPLAEPFNLGNGFRRDAENGNRDGRAPHYGLVARSAIRNSQFEMVRASFPVFILGWTIGAIGV